MTATIEAGAASGGASGGEAGEGESPRPFALGSYSHLLRFPGIAPAGAGGTPAIDAIVVPTVRSAERLRSAVDLASQLRCQLVALYTDRFPDGLPSVLAKLQPGMATEVALSSDPGHSRLDLGPAIPQSRVPGRALDISRKRNIGLLIGRACGWTRMLFLDDDIRRINAEKVRSAAALMGRYPVVGLQVRKFPDASVVGHARRLTGHSSEPFISGGSLLVDPGRLGGFFPAVYHEDWLCLIGNLRRGEVAIGGSVGQLPYRPFTTPERAELEEFGDILASGLLWLVHATARANAGQAATPREYWQAAMTTSFWEEILVQRFYLLGEIIERLMEMDKRGADPARLESLKASWVRCGELTAREFVTFVDAWLDGLDAWQERLARVVPVASVDQALADLGLRHQDGPGHQGRRVAVREALARVPAARQFAAGVFRRAGEYRERFSR